MRPDDTTSDSERGGQRRGTLHPMDWAEQSGFTAEVLQQLALRLRRRRRWQAAAGGLTALILAGTMAWQMHRGAVSDVLAAPGSTVLVNSPARQVLPDGSVVDLRPGGAIRVEFADAIRRVVLERGEAHFDVAKNAERPFVVQAGRVEARAVGTAFSVELTPSATEIIVTEGTVAVERALMAAPEVVATDLTSPTVKTLTLLAAGHRAVVQANVVAGGETAAVEKLTSSALGERLAWRVSTLELSATPLEDAIPLFNRHGNIQLVLKEPGVGAVRLSGVIRADNTEILLRLLKEEHGIVAERRADGTVTLARAR